MGNIGFNYQKTPFRYISRWKDGEWSEGILTEDNILHINESSPALHYGQQCFEGLKVYPTKDGKLQLFRALDNAKRLNTSCRRLLMPEIPESMFIDACKQVALANLDVIPKYGIGETFYLRPFVIGVGENIGVKSATEFLFVVFGLPVGTYFSDGLSPVSFKTSDFDRAAPNGTGSVKVGGNYSASFLPKKEAVKNGYADCIYLDPKTHTKIEEVGAANFFGITHDNKFVTPTSNSILPSITKYSLLYLAKNYLGLEAEERDCFIDNLKEFKEAGACGTAAIITPINAIAHEDWVHQFESGEIVGEVTQKLYDTLVGIQFGDIDAPDGWITVIDK
ncbi:branched-chain amino acid aminotransferase [Mycoplasmatota bacterium zrk1]